MRYLAFTLLLLLPTLSFGDEELATTVTREVTSADDCNCLHDDECSCQEAFKPTWGLTGFFHLDGGYHHQSAINQSTLGDVEDGLGFRRARFAITGKAAEETSYILELDFAQTQPRFVDLWMQFENTGVGKVRIGRFRTPFGMTELTSIRELPFLERALPFSLAPFRQTGIMLFDTFADGRGTWATSGYRYLSDNFGNVYADGGGYGTATRVTYLPLDQDDSVVHLGMGYTYNAPGRGLVQFVNTNEFLIGQNPNLGPPGLSVLPLLAIPPYVNTGEMPTAHTSIYNVEGAWVTGSLAMQAEARWATVRLTNGLTNTFPGVYAQIRYVLTGETIPYLRNNAVLGRVTPHSPADLRCGDWGAWEVAARMSYLNLNGDGLPGPGRRLTDTTVGLNWYLSKHTKFQFNWIYAALADPLLGKSSANTFAFRGQVDF